MYVGKITDTINRVGKYLRRVFKKDNRRSPGGGRGKHHGSLGDLQAAPSSVPSKKNRLHPTRSVFLLVAMFSVMFHHSNYVYNFPPYFIFGV